ncbi:methylation [Rhodoferax ferrireducens T118]|uniref:Methylation n=1 Tax=Albidiferax ferrireducens (strain ATCC BAA-621 / DSM 15236 / T118) TaxID=338969 RepID=Q21T31_ALBFT|nr:type II secretion system protein [Rhodoferax ferrireducens]ABD71072.1 methylation [Rhodoferax ferrireducens T118]
MKQVQRGFTLIELVMVIVILGVLAAVAIPKFVDLKADAQQASMQGVAGAAASASAINYGGCSIATAASAPTKCKAVNTCTSVGTVLSGGSFPTGYTAASTTTELAAAAASNGETRTCKLTLAGYTASPDVTFEVIGAGN